MILIILSINFYISVLICISSKDRDSVNFKQSISRIGSYIPVWGNSAQFAWTWTGESGGAGLINEYLLNIDYILYYNIFMAPYCFDHDLK